MTERNLDRSRFISNVAEYHNLEASTVFDTHLGIANALDSCIPQVTMIADKLRECQTAEGLSDLSSCLFGVVELLRIAFKLNDDVSPPPHPSPRFEKDYKPDSEHVEKPEKFVVIENGDDIEVIMDHETLDSLDHFFSAFSVVARKGEDGELIVSKTLLESVLTSAKKFSNMFGKHRSAYGWE